MAAPSFLLRRAVVVAALLAIGQGFGAAGAWAEEHRAPAPVHAASSSEPAAAASGVAGTAVAWPDTPARIKSPRGPRDPMDMLRERLAQKLGAVKAPDPDVMRVIVKTSPDGVGKVGQPEPRAVIASTAPLTPLTPSTPRKPRAGDAVTAVRTGNAPLAMIGGTGPRIPLPDSRHWAYDGSGGPQAWADLSPQFSTCANGSRQSPIDIQGGIKVELDPVRFDYKPGGFRVIDTGQTVQVNVAAGSSIEVLGRHYELVEFHFHRPSEERIDGKQFDMVVHLVHKDLKGRLAVVAVLLERGSAQPLVQSVWNNLPLEKGDELAARVALDPNDLLPAGHGYYTYMGSLTTPPCSEGVLWMVMKEPVQISSEQLGIFARLYPMNARPIQSASGRLIKESN